MSATEEFRPRRTTSGRRLCAYTFVPLADVPDLAWQAGLYPRGPRASNPESPNHFADMDEPPPNGGKTLLDLCRGPRGTVNAANVDPAIWLKHYQLFSTRKPRVRSETRPPKYSYGLLPFRVAQIYRQMVNFVRKKDIASFVAAAGIVAHYVGDAGQPLHISYLHHGDPAESMLIHMRKRAETFQRIALAVRMPFTAVTNQTCLSIML